MQYIGSLKAAEKRFSAKIFEENLHTSVKCDPADQKVLQISTDSQRSKTWER